MKTQLHLLASKRQEIDEMEEQRKGYQAELEQSLTFKKIQQIDEVLAQLQTEVKEFDEAVRKTAMNEWVKTSEKQLPGCTVGLYKVLAYDEGEAIKFCMAQDFVDGLSLKKTKFKELANVMKPSFVRFSEEPRVKINKNLTEFL